MTTVVLDSGILYALFDKRDHWHAKAQNLVSDPDHECRVPITTLPEVAYLLETRFAPPVSVHLAEWLSHRQWLIDDLVPQDLRRMTHLIAKYSGLGFVDASIVAIAERLFIGTIATTDRRHFEPIQPSHTKRFTLVP